MNLLELHTQIGEMLDKDPAVGACVVITKSGKYSQRELSRVELGAYEKDEEAFRPLEEFDTYIDPDAVYVGY